MTDTQYGMGIVVSALVGGDVVRIGPDASLAEVADALTAGDVGLLVVAEGDDVDAVVSERDVVRALADRRDPATTRAIEVANTSLIWCDSEATIGEVATKMINRFVRHVLVEEDGRLVGVVSARDLLGAYASGDVDLFDPADLE